MYNHLHVESLQSLNLAWKTYVSMIDRFTGIVVTNLKNKFLYKRWS